MEEDEDIKKRVENKINYDEFSIEDLRKYLQELNKEIERVKVEVQKKVSVKESTNLLIII